jgi:hypothetical protein
MTEATQAAACAPPGATAGRCGGRHLWLVALGTPTSVPANHFKPLVTHAALHKVAIGGTGFLMHGARYRAGRAANCRAHGSGAGNTIHTTPSDQCAHCRGHASDSGTDPGAMGHLVIFLIRRQSRALSPCHAGIRLPARLDVADPIERRIRVQHGTGGRTVGAGCRTASQKTQGKAHERKGEGKTDDKMHGVVHNRAEVGIYVDFRPLG